MAARWNGPFGNALPDMQNKNFIGLGISPSNNSCIVVGALFISGIQDLEALAEEYSKKFLVSIATE